MPNPEVSRDVAEWTCAQCARPTETLPTCRECEDANGPTCERCHAAGVSLVTIQNGNRADVATCEDCARRAGYRPCDRCEDWSPNYVSLADVGDYRCETCARATDCHPCERCQSGEWYARGAIRGPDGDWYCADHAEDFTTCDTCERSVWQDDSHSTEAGGTYCDPCYANRGEDGSPVSYRAASEKDAPPIPEYLTVGVEIEAILPAYPSDWELTTDGSVEDNGGKETVSPILRGSEGMRRLFGAVRAMERNGSEPVANGGTHVHIGIQDLTVRETVRILRAWSTWGEDIFSGLVPGYRWGTDFCDSQYRKPDYANRIEGWAIESGSLDALAVNCAESIGDLFPDYTDRYVSLNPCAIPKHGTLEFRIFPSDVNPRNVTTWASLCARFVDVARHCDSNGPDRVRSLLDSFGTMRAGLRILSRGSDSLRADAADVSASMARAIPSRYSTIPGRDPWGKSPERKTARKAKRKANPRATVPNEFLFPMSARDVRTLSRIVDAPAMECDCEHGNPAYRSVHCPAHGLTEFGHANLPGWDRGPFTFTASDSRGED